jgi:hypothetical protein
VASGQAVALVVHVVGRASHADIGVTNNDREYILFQTSYQLPHETLTTSSTLRFPSREQVEALIARSRLIVRDVLGNWQAGPLDSTVARNDVHR